MTFRVNHRLRSVDDLRMSQRPTLSAELRVNQNLRAIIEMLIPDDEKFDMKKTDEQV